MAGLRTTKNDIESIGISRNDCCGENKCWFATYNEGNFLESENNGIFNRVVNFGFARTQENTQLLLRCEGVSNSVDNKKGMIKD